MMTTDEALTTLKKLFPKCEIESVSRFSKGFFFTVIGKGLIETPMCSVQIIKIEYKAKKIHLKGYIRNSELTQVK